MAHIRPATLDDTDAIGAVQSRNGLGSLDREQWRRWRVTSPFRSEFSGVPIGWVLETDAGDVVGAFSNIHMLYDFGGQPVKAASGSAWAVDTEYRSYSLLLLYAYFQQKGIDLWLDTSANEAASRILTGMRIKRIPAPDYDAPLLWPIRYGSFISAALRRKNWRVPRPLIWPLAGGFRIADRVRRGRSYRPPQVRRLKSFDERFDVLWEKLRCGPPRLRAVRTRACLEWRFQAELSRGTATALVYESGGDLQGYAILVEGFRDHLGLKVCDLADLQALGDDHGVIGNLLLGACNTARENGAEAFKFLGGQAAKRAVALSLRPYSYRSSPWQLYYKVSDQRLGSMLAHPQNWDFSPFDSF